MNEQNSRKQVAVFIDTANCRNVNFEQALHIARRHGDLAVMQAYGNFANSRDMADAAQKLFTLGVRLIHCPAWTNGRGTLKSTADEILMSDVLSFLHTYQRLEVFIICSGDGHYIPIISEIRKQGKEAIVMADPQSVSRWIEQAASEFIPLTPVAGPVPQEVFQTLVQAVHCLQKVQSRSAVYAGNVKPKMKELLGDFDEKMYRNKNNRPFKHFTEFLKEAQSDGWIRLIEQQKALWVTTAPIELAKAA